REEAFEGDLERAALHGADGVVVDVRVFPGCLQASTVAGCQCFLAAHGHEVFHLPEREIDGVDREGAERGIGAAFSRRGLDDRQELEKPVAGGREPANQRRQVGDLADAPVALPANGEQRQQDAGLAAAFGHGELQRAMRLSATPYRRRRSMIPVTWPVCPGGCASIHSAASAPTSVGSHSEWSSPGVLWTNPSEAIGTSMRRQLTAMPSGASSSAAPVVSLSSAALETP